ncbi:hypothetical protein LUW74_07900 [Actinomadura madurae]|uniref:hypothetical protein n=1 Tax=Actinomadura madurae TaxID=1993 RepID=UPI0020261AF5|nr:hypothetical protein [Actinomadura madurae]URN03277.1 hypothetical protein LUW74_07900 [Actinomadura madurae]
MRKRALSVMIAAMMAMPPVLTIAPSAAAVSCSDRNFIVEVVVNSAPVHSNYYGSAPIIARFNDGKLIHIDKLCINNFGNLWYHTDWPSTKGWIYRDYVEYYSG